MAMNHLQIFCPFPDGYDYMTRQPHHRFNRDFEVYYLLTTLLINLYISTSFPGAKYSLLLSPKIAQKILEF